jgi:hypothetical protein
MSFEKKQKPASRSIYACADNSLKPDGAQSSNGMKTKKIGISAFCRQGSSVLPRCRISRI